MYINLIFMFISYVKYNTYLYVQLHLHIKWTNNWTFIVIDYILTATGWAPALELKPPLEDASPLQCPTFCGTAMLHWNLAPTGCFVCKMVSDSSHIPVSWHIMTYQCISMDSIDVEMWFAFEWISACYHTLHHYSIHSCVSNFNFLEKLSVVQCSHKTYNQFCSMSSKLKLMEKI